MAQSCVVLVSIGEQEKASASYSDISEWSQALEESHEQNWELERHEDASDQA